MTDLRVWESEKRCTHLVSRFVRCIKSFTEELRGSDQIQGRPIKTRFIEYQPGRWTLARSTPGIPREWHWIRLGKLIKAKPTRLQYFPPPLSGQGQAYILMYLLAYMWPTYPMHLGQPILFTEVKHVTCYFPWATPPAFWEIICPWTSGTYRSS